MSTQGTIKRYSLILERVKSSHFPNFKEIHEFLDRQGFEMTTRTLQRLLAQMRDEFGVAVKWDSKMRGYYLDNTDPSATEAFYRFLEIAGTADALSSGLKDNKENLKYISFENEATVNGSQYIQPLLKAIRERKKIEITHRGFNKKEAKTRTVDAYHLREYQQRWYLIALQEGKSNFTTFGLDRIENLKLLSEKFERIHKDPVALFNNIVGIIYNNVPLVTVRFAATEFYAPYLRTLKIHKSQQELEPQKKGEYLFEIKVIPNPELVQQFLKMGDQVKVLSPKEFRQEVRSHLSAALKKYK